MFTPSFDEIHVAGLRALVKTSAEAYALVSSTGPALDPDFTKNFTAVNRPGTGVYCLTPAVGVDPNKRPAMVSPDYGYSAGDDLQAYRLYSADDCGGGQFEVVTQQNGVNSNQVGFQLFTLKN